MVPVPTNSSSPRVAFGPSPPRPKAVSAPPAFGSTSSAFGGGVKTRRHLFLVPSPEGRRGKVAPPRDEAETDGAGSHQLELSSGGFRSPSASTQSGLGTSPVRLRKLRLRGRNYLSRKTSGAIGSCSRLRAASPDRYWLGKGWPVKPRSMAAFIVQ